MIVLSDHLLELYRQGHLRVGQGGLKKHSKHYRNHAGHSLSAPTPHPSPTSFPTHPGLACSASVP